ncbi:MAG: superoxide dismutase family protein [Clostridia bacterium]|nr:superoxide dismutase family protein [Clostridia bacterium]
MYRNGQHSGFAEILRSRPSALVEIRGGRDYPDIRGIVRFYQRKYSVLVVAEIKGLPVPIGRCEKAIFGFHLHEGIACTGEKFADTKGHYNPDSCPHPYHAGDMPPLFGVNGFAFSAFMTDRFRVSDIIGKTVVIHAKADDFTSQPAGNAGEKIACGTVRRVLNNRTNDYR